MREETLLFSSRFSSAVILLLSILEGFANIEQDVYGTNLNRRSYVLYVVLLERRAPLANITVRLRLLFPPHTNTTTPTTHQHTNIQMSYSGDLVKVVVLKPEHAQTIASSVGKIPVSPYEDVDSFLPHLHQAFVSHLPVDVLTQVFKITP
jgi:hypothetical protein